MVTRMRCRSSDGRRVQDARDEPQHDPQGNPVVEDAYTLGPHVATFGGSTHTVHIDDDGNIHVHKRRTAATRDKTYTERLKELADQYRKHIWW